MNDKNKLTIPLSILSASIIISVIIFSIVWKSARTADQTIRVTGSATKQITSNFAIFRGTLRSEHPNPKTAFQRLKRDMPKVIEFLEENNFSEDSVKYFTINSYPVYERSSQGYQTQNVSHYVYTQRIELKSRDVERVKDLSLEVSSLIEQGIQFNVEPPEYHYLNIDQLKIDMQALAAKNAKERAVEIAKATDSGLGPLRDASMGVIQIRPRYSNEVAGYGLNDVSVIEKEIMAVVTASFEIE